MKHIWKVAVVVMAVMVLSSCDNKKFNVTGEIKNAKDSVLYFEHVGLEGIDVLDSVKLGDNGSFSFSEAAPDAPEFYRLRISDQIINLAIDSTETVTFRSSWPQMASKYEVEGSENCEKIKALTLQLMDLRERAIAISQNDQLSIDEANDSLLAIITQYKNDVKNKYIFPTPGKSYAYFALFQTLGDMLLFNPRSNKDDIKVYAAVATSWDTYYPHAERGQNLHNIAIEGMKNQRIVEAKENQTIEASKVQEAGVLDIELTDNKGQVRHLTDLKGKVVLLDFHVFAMDESPARILTLRELYNKFHAQGFEVFQVSLDSDEHFWKQQTAALPWVNVFDPDGLQSQYVMMYNMQAVPDFFLIDRNNNLVKRASQIKNLEAEIKKLL
jgi:peroxiredoxin